MNEGQSFEIMIKQNICTRHTSYSCLSYCCFIGRLQDFYVCKSLGVAVVMAFVVADRLSFEVADR